MAAAFVHKAARLRVTGALIVVIATTGCAAVGDDSAGDEPAVPITAVGSYPRLLMFTEDFGVQLTVVTGQLQSDPRTGCLVLESVTERGVEERGVMVWPLGSEPVVVRGTAGALVPDVGTFMVGDQLHAYGWIGPPPSEDSRPHAVVDCLRDDLALAYAFAVERVDGG
jgi:hypothetical protein